MAASCEALVSIARMHHIRSMTKFRRLKQHARNSEVRGFAKIGKPGVLVFRGTKYTISTFLENARALRYLDFHHVDTRPLSEVSNGFAGKMDYGLVEVEDMKALIHCLEKHGLKEWFRSEMGMSR